MDDDDARALKAELYTAIRNYYSVLEPNEYVTGWVLITHRDTHGDIDEDNSYVGVAAPDGQSFVVTRGLLTIANEGETVTIGEEGD